MTLRAAIPVLVFVLFSSAAAIHPSAGASPDSDSRVASIDALVQQYMDADLFTGSVLVSEHDAVLFKKGYGLANREWGIPNGPDTKFRLGSITKQFTATLVLKQVAAGTLRLDGHLVDYLPYYRKDTGTRVTIDQLLHHTSGIPSYTDDPTFFPKVSRDYHPVEEFVKTYCSGDLQFEPGTKFRYDNSGYFLLGAVLEQVTGHTYEDQLRAEILDPLGMTNTGYDHFDRILPKRAAGYQHDLAGVINAPFLDMSLPFAAGALYSTVEDLHTWDQALYTDRLLPPALKQAMFTPGLEHYGYGWVIQTLASGDPDAGKTMIAHGGGINGFNTLEQRLPDRHLLVVLLNNTPAANLDALAKGIRTILDGGTPDPPRRLLLNTLGPTILTQGADAAIAQDPCAQA